LAREIAEQTAQKKELRDAFLFLSQYGISNTLAVKIYQIFGSEIYHIIRENPYRLAEEIKGVGFRIADEIAAYAHIAIDSDYRIRAGLMYVMMQSTQEGHCYLPKDNLTARAETLLAVVPSLIELQLDNLAMDRKLIIKSDQTGAVVYLPSYYYAELQCAKKLSELAGAFPGNISDQDREAIESKVLALARDLAAGSPDKPQLELDALQLQTILQSVAHGLFILSGGPGTGKTTTINLIIAYFASEGKEIALAAPTGRAAKRMSETTGFDAMTIHRLLEINTNLSDEDIGSVRFERNEENPLEADVVIIDEMSMVDITIFNALLKAIVPGTRLILVGDVNQLPSVGPGQVLRDIMNSRAFPMVVLQRIFRQAHQSDIIVNAHRINQGQSIELTNQSKDFFYLERKEVNVIYKHIVLLILEKLPGYVNASPFDIQVLTPMRKGPLGVEVLNNVLQSVLNPPASTKREHISGQVVFREGDKVMQTKNNYQMEWEIPGNDGFALEYGIGVFNGDMGRIIEIHEELARMKIEFDDAKIVDYPFTMLSELDLAYAITIHKSQGNEYPAVILPLLTGPKMLFSRNLLYTGVTRAKSCVVIVGSRDTVTQMIQNESESRRYSSLTGRIHEIVNLIPVSKGLVLAACRQKHDIETPKT
jgi:exodeoxyribonuclease V alpha subunit